MAPFARVLAMCALHTIYYPLVLETEYINCEYLTKVLPIPTGLPIPFSKKVLQYFGNTERSIGNTAITKTILQY